MSQFRAFLDRDSEKGQERSVGKPFNIEEEHRKNAYPEICSEECEYRTCGYYRQENFGKPCQMLWEPHKTQTKPTSDPLARTSLEKGLETMLEKVLKPIHDRIDRLENEPEYRSIATRSFNVTPRETLPVGFPRLFKELLRRSSHD